MGTKRRAGKRNLAEMCREVRRVDLKGTHWISSELVAAKRHTCG